jgi:hypothetical protein
MELGYVSVSVDMCLSCWQGLEGKQFVRCVYQQAADSTATVLCINIALPAALKPSPAVFGSAGNKSLSNTAGLLKLFHKLTEVQGFKSEPTSVSLNPIP